MIDQYLKPNVKQGAIYYFIIALIINILMLIPFLNCIVAPAACLVGFVLPFAIGWLVAQWAKTMPARSTPLAISSNSPYATPAVDGGVAAAVGAFFASLISWIISLLFSGVFAAMGNAGAGAGQVGSAAVGLAIGAGAGVVGIIFGTIFAAIFGAIGGVIYVVYTSRRPTTSA